MTSRGAQGALERFTDSTIPARVVERFPFSPSNQKSFAGVQRTKNTRMASPSTAAALAAPASEPPALSDPPASSRAEVPQAEGKAEKVADDESEAESGTNRTPYSQKMEEALSCVICHCIFYNCVSLSPCMHSFCKGCVAQSLARSPAAPAPCSPFSKHF